MHKLQIKLERKQLVSIHALFISAVQKIRDTDSLSFGQWQLCHEVSKKITARAIKWELLVELGVINTFTFPVWHWELLLLTIAKAGLQPDTYNQITINEITEKLWLHMKQFEKYIHIP